MAHVNKRRIAQIVNRGVANGLSLSDHVTNSISRGCAKGKEYKYPIAKVHSLERAQGVLDRFHIQIRLLYIP